MSSKPARKRKTTRDCPFCHQPMSALREEGLGIVKDVCKGCKAIIYRNRAMQPRCPKCGGLSYKIVDPSALDLSGPRPSGLSFMFVHAITYDAQNGYAYKGCVVPIEEIPGGMLR